MGFDRNDIKEHISAVKEYWESVAKTQEGDATSWSDSYMLRLEENAIISETSHVGRILDVGCGVGRTLFLILQNRPKLFGVGIDCTEDFISKAKERVIELELSKRSEFHVSDLINSDLTDLGLFNTIISERFLINLPDESTQFQVLDNLIHRLDIGGKVLIVEATKEGLSCINLLRNEYGLDSLNSPWFNRYISIENLQNRFSDCVRIEVQEFASSYFLITRFLKEILGSNRLADPLAPTNYLGHLLPNVGNFGVHKLIIFTKVN